MTFRQMGVGNTRAEAEAWLHMAADAGLVESRPQQHPKNPALTITTWWLPGSKPAMPSTPLTATTQAAPQDNNDPENATPAKPPATTMPEGTTPPAQAQPVSPSHDWRGVIS
jgi:hypothetical protein